MPAIVNPIPRLVLLAGSFHGRTESAVDFLIENRLPVKVVPVTIYEDQQGRRFVDIESDHEPEFIGAEQVDVVDHTKIGGRRVRITDLLDAGLLEAGDLLRWTRPQLGRQYEVTVNEAGTISTSDGRTFTSPSRAAIDLGDVAAIDGWHCWRVDRLGGKTLDDLRRELAIGGRPTG